MRLSLHRATLSYADGLAVHTASSGRVPGLDEIYLRILDRDGIEGVGEVRVNIAYLNGLSPEAVIAEVLDILPRLDLSGDPADLLADPPARLATASAPVRMLVDIALQDLDAKRAGLPLAVHLGAEPGKPVLYPTNQTLFIADAATVLARTEAYVERGFHELKLRIGSGDFQDDLLRVRLLRDRFGDEVKVAADANGAWDLDAAQRHLDALAPFALSYVEQPVAPCAFDDLARLAQTSPIPIMLDESVAEEADVAEIARIADPRLMAHLKLVKLGGIAATRRAALRLGAAGVPFMIGQMNEGGLATAAALHLCVAVRPDFAELYGADGLLDDPAPGLDYRGGSVAAPPRSGLGLAFAPTRTETLWES